MGLHKNERRHRIGGIVWIRVGRWLREDRARKPAGVRGPGALVDRSASAVSTLIEALGSYVSQSQVRTCWRISLWILDGLTEELLATCANWWTR